jgi:epoxyqueuosine reductase
MTATLDLLHEWAVERGYPIVCGHVTVLDEVRAEVRQRRRAGELDATFAGRYLASFCYENSSEDMAEARAVIMLALPRPAHRVVFALEKGAFEAILPPTYVRYRAIFKEVQEEICCRIPRLRGHLEILEAPLKAVACRMGLTMYGRNNISYIPEFGSYFQLLGYVTDRDLGIPDNWRPQPAQLMPDCEGCGICESACPTGAISEDRMLLHAECCTTYFSEVPGDLQHELAAQCLFGCLECQQICPANKSLLRVESTVTFTREETALILANGAEQHGFPETIQEKLQQLGLTEEPLIGRNLGKLLAARSLLPSRA